MLKPNPSLKRQLSNEGPILLWRNAHGGGREVLALAPTACANNQCACRDVIVEGWRFGDELRGATLVGESIKFIREGGNPALAPSVLYASVNLDDATILLHEDEHPSQPWALEWLREELDPELMGVLRERFTAARSQVPTPDWRKQDWSWWRPGMDAAWLDLHLDDEEFEVEVDDTTYTLTDLYCVEPNCACEEVSINVMRVSQGEDLVELGEILINPTYPAAPLFRAHGRDREALKKVWAAMGTLKPMPELLLHRREVMCAQATEIHRLFSAPARTLKTVNRNDPCPCGSGLKYKKCCIDKVETVKGHLSSSTR